jgi:hypothetical protein
MEALTVDTLPPVAADHDPVRCLLAIELSKKSWFVAITTALSDKISRYTLDGCDWKGLLELMERVRTRVAREVGRPVEMISCYEAGYDGFWLHRLLERQGVRSHVIDPASVQVDRRARRAKTDHIDAARLLRSLMAYLRGEPKVWSVLCVPSVAEEDDRRLHRERDRLIAERGQHVNRSRRSCGQPTTRPPQICSRKSSMAPLGNRNRAGSSWPRMTAPCIPISGVSWQSVWGRPPSRQTAATSSCSPSLTLSLT